MAVCRRCNKTYSIRNVTRKEGEVWWSISLCGKKCFKKDQEDMNNLKRLETFLTSLRSVEEYKDEATYHIKETIPKLSERG